MNDVSLTFFEEKFLTKSDNFSDDFELKAAMTDFAVLCGGYVSKSYFINDGTELKDRTGYYWTRTDDGDNDVRAVHTTGTLNINYCTTQNVAARPALLCSSIENLSPHIVRGLCNVSKLNFGVTPQTAVSEALQTTLHREFSGGRLEKIENAYTTPSPNSDSSVITEEKFPAYSYNGKIYARHKANFYGEKTTLSNGIEYKDGDYVWVELEPIEWLITKDRKNLLSKKLLFTSPFHNVRNYKGDFESTYIYNFMENHFSKDLLLDTKQINVTPIIETEKKVVNPYKLDFGTVTEEEIIKGAVQSDVAVYLHGSSSVGKSARVQQLDPELTLINGSSIRLDALIGKSVYIQETGEMVDVKPSWLKKIEKKAIEKPDKIHILFIDEIANAVPAIQNLIFDLVLEKEVNSLWRLPQNCRIVLAGNEIEDSLSANQITEPLFNRCAHTYIETNAEKWLSWAATPKEAYEKMDFEAINTKNELKIHPAIYAFIAYRKDDVLRTKYTGDKPNADQRKWEMASKMLYKTNKPEMLRALVGEEVTKEFITFCNQNVITLEDVLNENYEQEFTMTPDERYATAVSLSSVDEKNVEKVRKFMIRFEPEIVDIFDTLWIQNDDLRMEKILEIKMSLSDTKEGGVRL
jgi:MoxR-like ATPases